MIPLLVAAGLGLGSVLANKSAQSDVNKARKGVTRAEQARQAGFDTEIDTINTGARGRYQGFEGQAGSEADELAALFAGSGAPASVMPASSSAVTRAYQASEGAETAAQGAQQNKALGNLMGFGEALAAISRAQGRDAASVGQLGGFKQGSAGVTGLEYEGANTKGGNKRLLGDALALASQIATGKAIGGGTLAGG